MNINVTKQKPGENTSAKTKNIAEVQHGSVLATMDNNGLRKKKTIKIKQCNIVKRPL